MSDGAVAMAVGLAAGELTGVPGAALALVAGVVVGALAVALGAPAPAWAADPPAVGCAEAVARGVGADDGAAWEPASKRYRLYRCMRPIRSEP